MTRPKERGLIVVLGAGASHDCHVEGLSPQPNKDWRPPLTSGIFSTRQAFQQVLTKYRYAVPAAAEFNRRFLQSGQASIEEFLRELGACDDVVHRRQFLHVGLYLQELLATASLHFLSHVRSPTAYTSLLSQIYSASLGGALKKVCIVTVNYDLLIEQAIETVFGKELRSVSEYTVLQEHWSLIKFHGSVNWGRRVVVPNGAVQHTSGTAFHKAIRAIESSGRAGLEFLSGCEVVDVSPGIRLPHDSPCYYPAIAVPIQGKYGHVCPDSHLDVLRDVMNAEELALLVIGFSAKDKDLLDELVRTGSRLQWVEIVNGSELDGTSAATLLGKHGLRCPTHEGWNNHVRDMGFAAYVKQDQGLGRFLKSIA